VKVCVYGSMCVGGGWVGVRVCVGWGRCEGVGGCVWVGGWVGVRGRVCMENCEGRKLRGYVFHLRKALAATPSLKIRHLVHRFAEGRPANVISHDSVTHFNRPS
jgi:hypothetical protein